MNTRMQPGDIVRHFKGNRYEILYFAKDSETQADVVVYRALYGERGVWVRPMEMFFSEVDHAKYPDCKQKWRFEREETTESCASQNKSGDKREANPDGR